MALSLASLFVDSSLESFIGAALYAGGVWRSPRHCDGILDCQDVASRGAVRMDGLLCTIDQRYHAFSLEVSDVGGLRWTLSLGAAGPTQQRAEKDLAAARWRVILDGRVELDGDRPVPVVDPA